MSEEANLVKDLALILISAGVFTIISKALKQPLILGYIVAGFIGSQASVMSSRGIILDKYPVIVLWWRKSGTDGPAWGSCVPAHSGCQSG